MNKLKQSDMIRKRNIELTEQLNDMRFQLEFNSQLNADSYRRANDLIDELEEIKEKWLYTLNDLNNKREEYSKLIIDLQKIKNIMTIINKLKSV